MASLTDTRSADGYRRALDLLPGGVNSPVRAMRAIGRDPLFVARGAGAELVDVDGNRYVDWVCSWGPLILGHADPEVVAAVQRAAADGTSFGAPTAGEVELARMLSSALPSVEQVRLVSSGTEATMAALRLARAATGRQAIVKFTGCYHGHVDSLLVRAGSGALTMGVPDSPGVPASVAESTLLAEFNDFDGVRALFRRRGPDIAALIVEPVAGNMGVVPPEGGFLELLREETARVGALLIFDEVITGFRLAWGGAQGLFGITPDLTCLGKIVGGGMPLAAYGGRRDLMQLIAPAGPVYQAGTLSGNPVSVAAGLATLEALRSDPRAYDRLEALGARAESGLREALRASGRSGCVNRVGSMLTLFLGAERVRDFATASQADVRGFAGFFHGMLAEGLYLPPSQFEAVLLSLAHTEADVDHLVAAAGSVLAGR
jgi:glutamate-1-semialdehyde 2,1-aminomutase